MYLMIDLVNFLSNGKLLKPTPVDVQKHNVGHSASIALPGEVVGLQIYALMQLF